MSLSRPTDYASQQRSPRKHLVGFGIVVLMHLALVWAINSGLARKFIKAVQAPVEAVLLEEAKPDIPPPPPPPPPPKKETPPPPPPAYVPPVEVPVTAAPAANAIAAVTAAPPPPVLAPPPPPPPPPPAPVVAKPAVRTAIALAAKCDKPEYPSASRRMEEEGTVTVRFLVGVDGRVVRSEIEKSSGSARLDEAARAGLAKCQYKPATVDGNPEETWTSVKYTWRLEE